MFKLKLIPLTTVPLSSRYLLRGQPMYMTTFFKSYFKFILVKILMLFVKIEHLQMLKANTIIIEENTLKLQENIKQIKATQLLFHN
jgi:hypothetical protein